MRSSFRLDGMAAVNKQIAKDIRSRAMKAVEIGGEGLKNDLRSMTGQALGDRLAKTWRLKLYGQDGSESPAAFIWTKAPRIIEGNMTGGTIVPVAGSRYLAIPTDSVPQRRGRGAKARMSPEEVEAYFNQDLILRRGRKAGTLLGFVDVIAARHKSRSAGRRAQLVLMFIFTRAVRQRRTIDPAAAFARWRQRTRQMLQNGV